MRAFLPIALVVAFACLSDGCGSKCETTSAPAATEKTGAMMDGGSAGIAADGIASSGAAEESCSGCPMEAAAKAACADEKASKGCCEQEKSCCPTEAKPIENAPAR